MLHDPVAIKARLGRDRFSLDVSVALSDTGITGLTGPSGAGKSTLLRILAGLDQPDHGRITTGPETWLDTDRRLDTPPHKRPIGFLFQDGNLFPDRTVERNLRYADARRPKPHSGPSWTGVVETMDIGSLLDRRPGSLSGGEKRRVALARTLLTGPDLLLLDEPMTGLDRARKRAVLSAIETVQHRFGLPMLVVSHDLADLARLADHTWVMDAGRIVASGTTQDVLANWTGQDKIDSGALLAAIVEAHDLSLSLTRVRIGDHLMDMPVDQSVQPGDAVRLWVQAQDVSIALTAPGSISIRNIVPARIERVDAEPERPIALVTMRSADQRLVANVSRASVQDLALRPDLDVFAMIKAVRLAD